MADYYKYRIKAVDETIDIGQLLGNLDNVEISGQDEAKNIIIDLEKVFPDYYSRLNEIYTHNLMPPQRIITYDTSDRSILYSNKWVPDEFLLSNITKKFPDIVFEVYSHIEWYASAHWWEKNGKMCAKDGTPVQTVTVNKNGNLFKHDLFIDNLTPYQVKLLNNGNYMISLPIGDDKAKWGTIVLPPNEVFQEKYTILDEKGPTCIPIIRESYNVVFNGVPKVFSAQNLVESFYNAKDAYRDKQQKMVTINESYARTKVKKEDFTIYCFDCSSEFSPSGYFTITLSDYSIANDGTLNIVPYGNSRNVFIYDENSVPQKISVKGSVLAQEFDLLKECRPISPTIVSPLSEEVTEEIEDIEY